MKQKITFRKFYQKSHKLMDALNEIHTQCNIHDHMNHHYFIDEDYRDFSDTPCAYTALYGEQFIGFLCPYPFNRHSLEFCLLILPEYRKRGIASNLFFQMVSDFSTFSYRTYLAPNNETGKAFLLKMGLTYGYRECHLCLRKQEFVIPHCKQNHMTLKANRQDDTILISAVFDNIEIGHLKLTAQKTTVCIHDVEVKETLRRNGYGYQMLTATLENIFDKYENVILHVTKENTPAYQLYRKIGFQTLEELDYYEL